MPRDTVRQHDPVYESWLAGRPPNLPIRITLDLRTPSTNPPPDYSRDETQLRAWEKANFAFSARQSFSCDHVITNGVESSFVTDIGLELTQPTFEFLIARHIFENMNDRGREVGERVTWRRIHDRIAVHAREHFTRYRQVVDALRPTIMQRFAALPNRNNPLRIRQQDLEAYVRSLLAYLVARLHVELWRTTCTWEHTDYPRLLSGIPHVGGRFAPACDPQPVTPPEPPLPVVVTPGASQPGPAPRQPRPAR